MPGHLIIHAYTKYITIQELSEKKSISDSYLK